MEALAISVVETRKRQKHEWSAERVALFLSLHEKGMSASEIAAEMGEGLTRNAIIGKSHRLGLVWNKKPSVDPVALAERRLKRLEVKRNWERKARNTSGEIRGPRIKLRDIVPPVQDHAIPTEQRKTLMELERHHCRWPVGEVGDPGFFFCGGTQEEGKPYCAGHCSVGFHQSKRQPGHYGSVWWGRQ